MTPFNFENITNPGVLKLRVFQAPPEVDNLSSLIKLDANESMLGPSQLVREEIKAAIINTNFYPDAGAHSLKNSLSKHLQVLPEQLTLGNGSNDVLDIIGRTFAGPGDEIIFSQYGFIVYHIVSQAVNATPVTVPASNWGNDLKAMLEAVTDKTKIIFLANPNNPTGTWFERPALESFLAATPEHVIVVLDEAYVEYSTDSNIPDGLNYLPRYPNLIVTRTFSKAYGLAALRVGYAIASKQITNLINRLRQPFNVNRFALTAAQAALEDQPHLQRTVILTEQGMAQWVDGLNELGLEYIPSKGNFICINVADAVGVSQLLAKDNIFVSPLANYGMPAYIRISIGTFEQNKLVLLALKKIRRTESQNK